MSDTGRTAPPRTIPQLIDHLLSAHPSDGVLHGKEGDSWRAYTAAETAALVERTALGLYALGVRPGARVALCAESSPQWVIADYAIASIGAVTVPIDTTLMASQILSILKNAEARVCLISGDANARRFGPIAEEAKLEDVIMMAPASAGGRFRVQEEVRARGDELAAARPALFFSLRDRVTEETPASVVYSWPAIGGEPRGAVLRHGDLMTNASNAGPALSRRRGDRALSCLPLTHPFERAIVAMCLLQGVRVYFSGSAEALSGDLRQVRPVVFTAAPRMLEKIYGTICAEDRRLKGMKKMFSGRALSFARTFDPESTRSPIDRARRALFQRLVYARWKEALGGSVRSVIAEGVPLSPHLARIFWTAGIPVLQGYGLGHVAPIVSLNRLDAHRIGSVGRAIRNVEIMIDEDGEICVRRSNAARGSSAAPDETKSAAEEGWVRTGDLGHLDSDQYLYVTGRKKNLIRKSPDKPAVSASGSSAFRMYHQS